MPATAGSARYYTDPEIACVIHQQLSGLDYVLKRPLRPPWWRARKADKLRQVELVGAARRGASHAALHAMQTGADLTDADRTDRLQLYLLTLVVAAMAGEER